MPSEEGGAGGSEIVKLCLGCARRCAALALPGRTREGARPRGARARRRRPACSWARASLAGTSAVRPAAARGSLRARGASPELCGAPGAGRGARAEAGARREAGGAPPAPAPGRGAPPRHRYSKPSTSPERYSPRLGGLCILRSHHWGWRRPTHSRTCRSRRAVISAPGFRADGSPTAEGARRSSRTAGVPGWNNTSFSQRGCN